MTQPLEPIAARLRTHRLWQHNLPTGHRLADRVEPLPAQHRHDHPHRQQKPLADRHPVPRGAEATARDEADGGAEAGPGSGSTCAARQ